MTWALSLLLSAGVPQKLTKPVLYAILAALALAAFFGLRAAYDRAVIARHEAKVEAHNAKVIQKADTHAVEQKAKDDARLAQESTDLGRIANAKVDAQSVAAQRRAFRDCVRWQQLARERGEPTPSCSAAVARSSAR